MYLKFCLASIFWLFCYRSIKNAYLLLYSVDTEDLEP